MKRAGVKPSDWGLGAALFLVAAGARALHAWPVPVPATDGAHYLAMAEAFGRGDLAQGFDCVFQGGTGLVVAPLVALGLDSHLAAKLLGALFGGVATALLYALCRCFARRLEAVLAALFFGVSFHGVRLAGEAYSESFFLMPACTGVLLALRGRVAAGAAIGGAFWFRPEALALLPLLWLRPARRRGARARAVGLALGVAAAHELARAIWRADPSPMPKLGFMLPFGPFGEPDAGGLLRHLLANLLALPRAALPVLEWVGAPLALLGLCFLWRRRRRTACLVMLALAVGWLAMLLLQVKPRFFLSQTPLLLPLVALALRAARTRLVSWRRFALHGMAGLALLAGCIHWAGDLIEPPRIEKHAEKLIGRHLRDLGVRHGELVTDLPRVAFYAGLHPPLPYEFEPALLRRWLAQPEPRWAVLGALREGREDLARDVAATWERLPLPDDVVALPGAERLLLLRRRRGS